MMLKMIEIRHDLQQITDESQFQTYQLHLLNLYYRYSFMIAVAFSGLTNTWLHIRMGM